MDLLDWLILAGTENACGAAAVAYGTGVTAEVLAGKALFMGSAANPWLSLMVQIFLAGVFVGFAAGLLVTDASSPRNPSSLSRDLKNRDDALTRNV